MTACVGVVFGFGTLLNVDFAQLQFVALSTICYGLSVNFEQFMVKISINKM